MKITVKLNKTLARRAAKVAEEAGYSSLDEFVEHVLEKEVARLEGAASDEEIAKKLKGLGYLE